MSTNTIMHQLTIFDFLYPSFKFQKSKPLKLIETFAGLGSQALAMKQLAPVDIRSISEIDSFAVQAHNILHGDEIVNLGNIKNIESFEMCDILTWSPPCQDISKAGRMMGLENGTRSSMIFEIIRILQNTMTKPKVLVMENVIDLCQGEFVACFHKIQIDLEKMGYKNYVEILNASDYGIPQNRERLFMVSVLGDYNYVFPKPIPLKRELKNYIVDFDEGYFLTPDRVNATCEMIGMKYSPTSIADLNIIKGIECGGITVEQSKRFAKKPLPGLARTITTRPIGAVAFIKNDKILAIKKYSPSEALSLMGLSRDEIRAVEKTNLSATQKYKLAGNTIVVDVIKSVLSQLF